MNPLLSDTHTFIIVLIPPKTIDLLYRLKHEMLSTEDEAIAPLLPNTLEELKAYERVSVGRERHIQRDLDWIKKNGTSRMTRQNVLTLHTLPVPPLTSISLSLSLSLSLMLLFFSVSLPFYSHRLVH